MKNKIIILIIISILIFSVAIVILVNSGTTTKNKIIKRFRNNKELFEKSIIELIEESEDIYFEIVRHKND